MDINDIRKIGARLKREIRPHLEQLCKGGPLGKGAGGDITHPIDKRAEDIVLEEVKRLKKAVTLVSEECGIRQINGGGPALLVDPIDGSRNALGGITMFSTSIALVDGRTVGDTVIGYILNIMSDDEFWAVRDRGSFLNGKVIRTQREDAFKVAAYEARVPARDISRILPLLSLCDRTRCLGSTALDMAFLSRGGISVFAVPAPTRSFDFAAGWLLVKEAGGMVTALDGKGIDDVEIGVERATTLLASANKELHDKALEVLRRQ